GRSEEGRFHVFFFFQAEDGIRDWSETGVQTCALPIFCHTSYSDSAAKRLWFSREVTADLLEVSFSAAEAWWLAMARCSAPACFKIGRASCRERVWISVVAWSFERRGSGTRQCQ